MLRYACRMVPGLLFAPATCLAAETTCDSGTTAWMMISVALVLLMIPGLAMFYGGLVRTKNVLSTMMHSYVALAIIGVLWVAVGYSLTFGKSMLGGFIGWNPDYFFLSGIDNTITDGIPEYITAMFQGKFAIITPALISGALPSASICVLRGVYRPVVPSGLLPAVPLDLGSGRLAFQLRCGRGC